MSHKLQISTISMFVSHDVFYLTADTDTLSDAQLQILSATDTERERERER